MAETSPPTTGDITDLSASLNGERARGRGHDDFLGNRPRRKHPNSPAVVEHQDSVRTSQQLGELRACQQNAFAFVGEFIYELVDVLFGRDIDSSGRVIEKQNDWISKNPPGQQGLLLIATTQGPHGHIGGSILQVQARGYRIKYALFL